MTPYRAKQLQHREEAILDTAHGLLGTRGYDLMTMDDVAAGVGIAKGSLYKHFDSKEDLATAAMIRLLNRTVLTLESFSDTLTAGEKLTALLTWALRERLAGGVPHLPSNSPSLEEFLLTNEKYLAAVFALNSAVMMLIDRAKAARDMRDDLPTDFIMTTIYARTCDPTLDRLKNSGTYSGDEIVKHMVSACLGGLAGAKSI